jgi:hypothetical protein
VGVRRGNIPVNMDEVEECSGCGDGEVQYGEMGFERRIRAALMHSNGRLR